MKKSIEQSSTSIFRLFIPQQLLQSNQIFLMSLANFLFVIIDINYSSWFINLPVNQSFSTATLTPGCRSPAENVFSVINYLRMAPALSGDYIKILLRWPLKRPAYAFNIHILTCNGGFKNGRTFSHFSGGGYIGSFQVQYFMDRISGEY